MVFVAFAQQGRGHCGPSLQAERAEPAQFLLPRVADRVSDVARNGVYLANEYGGAGDIAMLMLKIFRVVIQLSRTNLQVVKFLAATYVRAAGTNTFALSRPA